MPNHVIFKIIIKDIKVFIIVTQKITYYQLGIITHTDENEFI